MLVPWSIHNYSILFLIIMKDKGPKVFRLTETNSALDFRKNNTSSVNTLEGIIFNEMQMFQLQEKQRGQNVLEKVQIFFKFPSGVRGKWDCCLSNTGSMGISLMSLEKYTSGCWGPNNYSQSSSLFTCSRVAVAEWLARPPTKQEVCGSNPASYLCWNMHVGKLCWPYTPAEVSHQRWCMPLQISNKAAHSGFETHRRCPKQGYQWPPRWKCVQQILFFSKSLFTCIHNTKVQNYITN